MKLSNKISPAGIFFTLLIAVVFNNSIHAQRGQLSIDEEPGISTLLDAYKNHDTDSGYYTIQVGFGSYSQAERIKRDVEIDFPNWYSKIIFDSPTYRVQLGRFREKLDAERAFIEVREKYPASLLLKPQKKRS